MVDFSKLRATPRVTPTVPRLIIAITGHRPDKLGGYDRDNPIRVAVREQIRTTTHELVAKTTSQRSDHIDVGGEFDHTRAIAIPLGSLPVVRYGQKFDTVTPATVTALMRYTVLSKALAAALKADAGRFTPAQVAELKTRCLTPALYFSPPTTTVYDDLRKAIDRGEVDTRIGYKIQIGTPEILHVGELYAGNEYLARRFTVTGADGVEVKKPTMVDALAPSAKVAIKALSARTKLNPVDAISYPIYSSLLGGNVPGAIDDGGSGVVNDMLHEAGMRVRDVDKWRKAMSSDKPDDRAAALRSALDLVEEHLAATWAELRPLVFYVGASGLVPDELGAVALDAAALAQRFPDVSLGKAEKEGTFFVLPGDVVLSVYTVQAHYTVDRPPAPASAAA
ncbi:MAG: hypothetical protein E6Q97_39475 [Desulfurellales bacterium]|nr:MAG: hypothetical protein E6Q97_39475 [Desulfurellales bacterium]